MKIILTTAAVTLALSACSYEAGYEVDSGHFGNATYQNTAAMTGDYVIDLARRFSEEVPNTVNFEFNSTALDGAARQILDRQADWIRKFPEVRFRVYGFTDAVGSTGYNHSLGKRRANAIVSYLSQRGISRSRLEAVVSYGETQPIIDTPNPERVNRRAVTEVSGFVKRHPTIMDGKYAEVVYREYIASAVPATTLTGIQTGAGTAGQ